MPLVQLSGGKLTTVPWKGGLPDTADPFSFGLSVLDALLPWKGLPAAAISEIVGSRSAGKVTLCAMLLRHALAQGRMVAFIDSAGTLFPTSLAEAGVAVERLLLVFPKTAKEAAWSADLLLSSHELDLVILDLPNGRVAASPLLRLGCLCRESGAALLLLAERSHASSPAVTVSLRVQRRDGIRLSVEKIRGAAPGRSVVVAA